MTDTELLTALVAVVAVLAAFGMGVIAGCVRWDRQRRTIRELRAALDDLASEANDLEASLCEERELVARLTGGTDDIIRAARGAHHRDEEPTDG